ncbi:DUF4132 domain-containing protein [Streptomyces sp. NPDC059816]|uniref:DUF4132 domain-containing protein n=1 Tax=Streptomyces sp. NPDC059816 TaxID=3346960 RepID=UPI00365F5F88
MTAVDGQLNAHPAPYGLLREEWKRLLGPVTADYLLAGDHRAAADHLLRSPREGPMAHEGFRRWAGAFTRLPEPPRRAILAALVDRWHEETAPSDRRPRRPRHREDSPADVLWLIAVVGAGLPDPPLPAERAAAVAEMGERHEISQAVPQYPLLEQERVEGREFTAATIASVRRTAASIPVYYENYDGAFAATLTEPVLNVGEAWADRAMAEQRFDPRPVLAHALTATSSKPSARWDRGARAVLAAAGDPDTVRSALLDWLARVGRPRTLPLQASWYQQQANELYDAFNIDALRGLAWMLPLLPPHPDVPRTLGALVAGALRKVSGTGARSPRTATAAIHALARTEGEEALAELARLRTRVVHKPTVKVLDGVLTARAAALGLGREEIEELAVPSYGLTEVGRAEHALGDASALLAVEGTRARLTWRNAAGKQVKTAPAAVRRDHPERVKELRALAKDVDRMLSAQAERLDRQFLARRSWVHHQWRARYLDHPVVGTLARRLIWTVDDVPVAHGTAPGDPDATPASGLRTVEGHPVEPGPDAEVRLWHPVRREPAEVTAWQDRLERLAVTQPFKQAHREVYPLTPAERTTGTYSNRFAGHYLRQHQFHSLTAVRGWRNTLRLPVDDACPPAERLLPEWGLRAEYWIEPDTSDLGRDQSDSGTYLRLRTDQVRFYPADAPRNYAYAGGGAYQQVHRPGAPQTDPVPLTEVPELVLSEVLRDVDLFVGVTSIGNDPTWADGGPGGHFHEYWTSYGFGELDGAADTRRAVLARLLPRLAIADRCSVEGRYLHVRGDQRTYKIHLGSANVLMVPGDTYLCIVQGGAGSAPDPGYLPFEGDRRLALILSKAVLLADDTAITDPTITSQFPRS